MRSATSADGTRIAFDVVGEEGLPAVVITGGAFSTADAGRPLAAALTEHGLRGVILDRRARGDSGDTRPYSPIREAEDLDAVAAAVGGPDALLGHSSGAVLSLLAAAHDVPTRLLFLSEPPFHAEQDPARVALAAALQRLVDDGRPEEAVTRFQREAVGLSDEVVQRIRASAMFPGLVAMAQSTVYDATIAAEIATPTEAMLAVKVPAVVLRGGRTFPFLVEAADRITAQLSDAELVIVPESVDHAVDPAATARVVGERMRSLA